MSLLPCFLRTSDGVIAEPEAVEPEDLVDDGSAEAEGDATVPEPLPVPESLPEGRRRELDR